MKKVLIFGGTGNLGKAIFNKIYSQYQVFIITRKKLDYPNYFYWNYVDFDEISNLAENSFSFINLVGFPISKFWTEKNKKKIYESRINTTASIVNLVKSLKNPPKIFIQASAVGYYPYNHDGVLSENSEPGDGFLSKVCIDWENQAYYLSNLTNLRIIRTGIVLDRNSGFFKNILLATKLGILPVFGDGKNFIPWIHVDDYAAAVEFLLSKDTEFRIFNLVAPNTCQQIEIINLLKNKSKFLLKKHIPPFFLNLIFGRSFTTELLIASQKVNPSNLISLNFRWNYENIAQAINSFFD